MALTGKQHGRHKKEWDLACAKQGWDPKDDERRLQFYRNHKLPASRKDWHPKKHFDVFLREVAVLQNRVDIADRGRESVELGVERMNAALLLITGRDFARGIVGDMHDRESWAALADAELENLRNTLHNRLTRCLAQIRGTNRRGRQERLECPPSLAWVKDCAVNPAVDAIIAGKVAIRCSHGKRVWYQQIPAATWEARQRPGNAPSVVTLGDGTFAHVDPDHFADAGKMIEQPDLIPAPPKPRAVDSLHALAAAVGLDLAGMTDDDIPF